MASFKSILSDIGHGLEKVFQIGVVIATDAEPFVDMAFPGISVLYNATVSAVGAAESAAIAAGQQNGTGAQKLALVVSSIEGSFNTYWTSLGNKTPADLTTIENWVNTVVAGLNAIPSLAASAPVSNPNPTAPIA